MPFLKRVPAPWHRRERRAGFVEPTSPNEGRDEKGDKVGGGDEEGVVELLVLEGLIDVVGGGDE